MSKIGMLIDFTRCIGCKECVRACKEQNNLPRPSFADYDDLTAENYTVVLNKAGTNFRRICMHCEKSTCVSACPVTALTKTPEGAVIYDESKCIGCRYCMLACPFQVPKYEWNNPLPPVRKCIFCYDLVKKGEQPACAKVCPTGATRFDDRDKLLQYAKRLIKARPDRYVDHVYGEKEVGGSSVMFISGVPFEALGFRMDLGERSLPELSWLIMKRIPNVVMTGYLLLGGIWWIVDRRRKMEKELMERELAERNQENRRPGDDKIV